MKKSLICLLYLILFSANASQADSSIAPPLINDIGPDYETEVGIKYARIFAAIPNSNKNIQAQNWQFGPTFYRGRLGENEVKALVLGIDKSSTSQITSRAFSNNAGEKIQNLLIKRGYNYEYLYLNTFTNTPSDEFTIWFNQLLGHVASSNSKTLEFILAIGKSGKIALQKFQETNTFSGGITVIYLENLQTLEETSKLPAFDFKFAATEAFQSPHFAISQNNNATTFSASPITSRTVFDSDDADELANSDANLFLDASDFDSNNVGWEPSRTNYADFDLGPGEWWINTLSGVADDTPNPYVEIFDKIPSLSNSNLSAEDRLPISSKAHSTHAFYRGHPNNSEVLVLADQFSHDDMIAGRALVGAEGQKLQAFLHSIGAKEKYTILRTLPVDTLGSSDESIEYLINVTQSWRQNIWKKIFQVNDIKVIFVLGPWAEELLNSEKLAANGATVISLNPDSFLGEYFPWIDEHLPWTDTPYERVYNYLSSANGVWYKAEMNYINHPIPIPRSDLPWGLPRWWGSSGDRVIRQQDPKTKEPVYKVIVPNWVSKNVR